MTKKHAFRKTVLVTLTTVVMVFFQNCGPAKLQGDFNGVSTDLAVGSTVDLETMQKAFVEPASNALSPNFSVKQTYDYTDKMPVIENIVLRVNDFNQIVWIHEPSKTVVSLGENFELPEFSDTNVGNYFVYGYRGDVPTLLSRFELTKKTTPSMPVNNPEAVITKTSVMSVNAQEDNYLVEFDAPNTDLVSVQWTYQGQVVQNRRAILVKKPIGEALPIELKLTDASGLVESKVLTLPAVSLPANSPDLEVAAISTSPSTPTLGQPVTMTAKISNLTSAQLPAGVPMTVSFYVDGKLMNWATKYTGGLSAGASAYIVAESGIHGVPTWTPTLESHSVQVVVNEGNVYPEVSTTNNSKDMALNVFKAVAGSNSICSQVKEGSYANLVCAPGKFIRQILFASYGTPTGTCGSFQMSSCHSTTTVSLISRDCIGKTQCLIQAANSYFGDPCATATKSLAIEAVCGD